MGQPQALLTTRDPSYLDTYANQVRISVSLSDLSITFGVTDDQGFNQPVLRDKVTVRLAPSTVKTLVLNLQTMIEAYEKSVSEIPFSPQTLGQLDIIKEQLQKSLALQMQPQVKP
jgi:hypothetical protein